MVVAHNTKLDDIFIAVGRLEIVMFLLRIHLSPPEIIVNPYFQSCTILNNRLSR